MPPTYNAPGPATSTNGPPHYAAERQINLRPMRRSDKLRSRYGPVKNNYIISDKILSIFLFETCVVIILSAMICPLNQVICRLA